MVLEEFFQADTAVRLEVVGNTVMRLEQIEKLIAHLVRRPLATFDLRVAAGVKLLLDLTDFQGSVAVGVQLLESLSD